MSDTVLVNGSTSKPTLRTGSALFDTILVPSGSPTRFFLDDIDRDSTVIRGREISTADIYHDEAEGEDQSRFQAFLSHSRRALDLLETARNIDQELERADKLSEAAIAYRRIFAMKGTPEYIGSVVGAIENAITNSSGIISNEQTKVLVKIANFVCEYPGATYEESYSWIDKLEEFGLDVSVPGMEFFEELLSE